MKQRITVDQLQQLTPEQQNKLKEWWKPKFSDLFALEGYCDEHLFDAEDEDNINLFNAKIKPFSLPLLSIGQCLSLLEPYAPQLKTKPGEHEQWNLEIWIGEKNRIFNEKEPIDALFKAVKSIL